MTRNDTNGPVEDDEDWYPGAQWLATGRVDCEARRMLDAINPEQYVGHRHHLVDIDVDLEAALVVTPAAPES